MSFRFLAPLLALLAAPAALAVSAGDPAPDFSAKNQDGKTIHLADYRGRFVLLYFYPKDETPGCTKEACAFRDKYGDIKKMSAVVFGLSRQDEKSHREFAAKHSLPFDLLVDQDGAIGALYGVKTMPVVGFLKRQSVLIGPDGKVIRFYESVDPNKHADEVISDLKRAGAR